MKMKRFDPPSFKPLVLLHAIIILSLSGQPIHANETDESIFGSTIQVPEAVASPVMCLYQAHFDAGTYIIREPGQYKLCEDITFFPNVNTPADVGAAEAFEPDFDNSDYDRKAFGLGFFAALSIASSNVHLDLNGFTIKQSPEHALLQRFFAVIELADSPFIAGTGPADFGGLSGIASDVTIKGPGTIGLSSHHGIHGNENRNVVIEGVTFQDFEVAAVSLNNVDGLEIKRCNVIRNRHDVPVLGMFSAAKFLRRYGKVLKDANYSMVLRGVQTSAAEVYDALVDSINTVYDDVVRHGSIRNSNRVEYELFHNPKSLVDGPCYVFLVNGKGPAVGDFAFNLETDDEVTSSDIKIKHNQIRQIKCWTNEVPAIVRTWDTESPTIVKDVRGAVLQLVRSTDNTPIAINPDGSYKGNVVADMQIMVAKAILDEVITDQILPTELQFLNPNTIDEEIIKWAERPRRKMVPQYRCNGDSMHHVGKGMTIIRLDATKGFNVSNNSIQQVHNKSPPSFGNCHDFHGESELRNGGSMTTIQQGANIRGIAASATSGNPNLRSRIWNNQISNFNSKNANVGSIIGIDIQGEAKRINLKNNRVALKQGAREDIGDKFIALRLRAATKKRTIEINDNDFRHEVLKVAKITSSARSNNDRAETSGGRCIGEKANSEWELGQTPGRCPFGFN